MKENLKFIELWLHKHAKRIIGQSLNSPVVVLDLDNFEKETNLELPQDFKDLYLWHNGMNDTENLGSLFQGMEFLSLKDIENKRDIDLENQQFSLDYADPEINSHNSHNQKWIVFAHDGGRTGLYLDLDPTEKGKLGQIIFIDHDYDVGILVADSIAELVKQFLTDLEDNLYFLNEDALEDGNEFLETDSTIDIINWHNSKRWARPDFS